MKTKVFTLLALACIGATACVDEIGNTDLGYTFEAGREQFEVPSKTTISSGNKTLWVAGDEVAVYADGASAVKCTAATAGENSGFNSDVQLNGSSFLMTYPYESALGIDNDNVKFRIPQSQVPTLNSFDPKAAVSVAATSDLAAKVMFKNALSLLKFTVPSHLDGRVVKINVETKGGKAVAGDVLCNPSTLANEMVEGGQAYTSVSVESETGLATGVYYIAVRPCTIEEGIKVTATLDDSKTYVRESGATTFNVNYIYNFGSVADALDIPRDWYITPGGDAQADGSSWQTATTLDNALSQAVDGATLHLAAGVYKPTVALPYMEGDAAAAASDAHKSFAITKNINIYGGYPSNPTTGAVADPSANKTILDGDGKSYQTVIVAAPKSDGKKVTISDVTIIGGKNTQTDKTQSISYNGIGLTADRGAGLALVATVVELNNVTIKEHSTYCAALYGVESTVNMFQCTVSDNTAVGNGGGVYLTDNTTLIMDGCSVVRNTTSGLCAGLYLYTSKNNRLDAEIKNSHFDNNSTTSNSGGVYVRDESGNNLLTSSFENCTFDGNTGAMGASFLGLNTITSFKNCSFCNNRNSSNGVIYINTNSSANAEAVFDGCTVSGNEPTEKTGSSIGGLYCYRNSSGTFNLYVMNSNFHQNYANSRGGGMYIRNNTSGNIHLTCVNSTFVGNSAGSTGSAIVLYGNANNKVIGDIISCTASGNISRHETNKGAFTCETAGNTFNFYNTIAVGNNTSGGEACDVYLKNAAAVASYKSSFIGSQYYGADGVASASTLNYTTMLGAFSNGVCPLLMPSDNPAFTGGMTADALMALAAGSMTAEILGKDQSGNSRTGTAAGAYVGSAAQQ